MNEVRGRQFGEVSLLYRAAMHVMPSLLCLNAKSSYALMDKERWMVGWIDRWMRKEKEGEGEKIGGREGECYSFLLRCFVRMSHLFRLKLSLKSEDFKGHPFSEPRGFFFSKSMTKISSNISSNVDEHH